MPPAPYASWTEPEVATLRAFVNDLAAKRQKSGVAEDEQFPPSLLAAYTGKKPTSGLDNTFLTTINCAANEGDLPRRLGSGRQRPLSENLAQFGGADFKFSFNENTRPTAQFLAGVICSPKDVAARAYLTAVRAVRRPYRYTSLTARPEGRRIPSQPVRSSAIYRKMLFRDATAGS